jgi:hypothetical protein
VVIDSSPETDPVLGCGLARFFAVRVHVPHSLCARRGLSALPGCISEGETAEEALSNIREAIELYIEPVER